MEKFGKSIKKPRFIIKLILVGIWIYFFINLYGLAIYLGKEYYKDPSNFVFFEDEVQRKDYKEGFIIVPKWIDDSSIANDCKPIAYFHTLYIDRLKPLIELFAVLILVSILFRINPSAWRKVAEKIESIDKSIEDM